MLRRIVQSAADANMNMLRVWGGGVFLPDAFYEAADEAGLLLYHDMQFAQFGHEPPPVYGNISRNESSGGSGVVPNRDPFHVERELRHQVRRLSHHASIAVWDGCNECAVVMDEDITPTTNTGAGYPWCVPEPVKLKNGTVVEKCLYSPTSVYATFILRVV